MKKDLVKTITYNAVVAAIYFLLSFITQPFTFSNIQIRIAEMLVLLCFFRKDFAIGVTIGCLLTNTLSISMLGFWDMLFGTLATLLSCVLVSFMKRLFIASLIPVVINGFVVGAEMYFLADLPFFLTVATVAIGELLAVSVVGYTIMMALGKKHFFQQTIRANQNLNFVW